MINNNFINFFLAGGDNLFLILDHFLGDNYDGYVQEALQKKIIGTINCSVPFVAPQFRKKSPICENKLLGKRGIEIYKSSPIELTNLWAGESFVQPPCRYHQFETRDRGTQYAGWGELFISLRNQALFLVRESGLTSQL